MSESTEVKKLDDYYPYVLKSFLSDERVKVDLLERHIVEKDAEIERLRKEAEKGTIARGGDIALADTIQYQREQIKRLKQELDERDIKIDLLERQFGKVIERAGGE